MCTSVAGEYFCDAEIVCCNDAHFLEVTAHPGLLRMWCSGKIQKSKYPEICLGGNISRPSLGAECDFCVPVRSWMLC